MNGDEVVSSTGEPAFAVDRGGRILAWNRAAEYSLGYRQSEVLGQPCWRILQGRDLYHNRFCVKGCSIRDMALRGEPVNRCQMFVRAATGEEVRVSICTLVVRGQTDKEVVHLLQPLSASPEEDAGPNHNGNGNGLSRLSPRRLEVLQHLADGKGTREIAELLGISQATVRHHIQGILTKLRVHSRLEAVSLGRRIGLV